MSTAVIRNPPIAHKDEEALIGCLLLDARAVLPLVSPIVSGADFADDGLGKAFDAIAMLADAGKPVSNGIWLMRELPKHGVDESIARDMPRLVNQVPNYAHAVYHAEHVRDAARLRTLCAISMGLANRSYDTAADPNEVTAWLESELAAIGGRGSSEAKTLGEVATEAIKQIEDLASGKSSRPGIYCGLPAIDQTMGPMLPGEVQIVAARTGSGKTAFAMQAGLHAAARGHSVLVFSLEMEGYELAKRIIAGRAGVDSRKLRAGKVTPEELERLREERDVVSELPIRLLAPPSATLAEIRSQARYDASRGNLRMLIVDYIGLVKPAPHERRLDRHLQVAAVSRGLKELAKELQIVVYSLCQLNRQGDSDEPRLTHLRESGSIEQDADSVLLLHVDDTERSNAFGQLPYKEAACNIAKFRHGQTGRIRLKWIPKATEFQSE